MADPSALAVIREALGRHDWQGGYDAARATAPEDREGEAQRLDALADAAWWLGKLDECIEARTAAYRIFEDLGDTRSAGLAAAWLSEHHSLRAQPAIGTGWLRRSQRALDGDDKCAAYGRLLLRQAEFAHGAGRLAQATDLAERARLLARELAIEDLEAESLQTLGRVLIDAGQPDEGLAHLDEAMLFAAEGRLGPYSTGKVYCSLISACEELGDLARAAEWTEATARWAEQHPLAIFPGICRVHRAVVLERRGALADAERELQRACVELTASHVPNAAAAYAELGDIRRRLGDLNGAEAAFARAEELSGGTCAGVALLRLAQGRVALAQRIIGNCLAGQPPHRPARARVLATAVQVSLAADDDATARTSLQELQTLAQTFTSPWFAALAETAEGRVHLARHDADRACACLRDSLQRWRDLDVPYEIATSNTLLGQALREAGDEDGAMAAFADARSLFQQIGARLEAVTPEPAPPRPAGLTEREVQVLRLIAAGRSNKQIAAELHLSPKTISRHLSNIFTKIGVSTRAAATAFAFEQRVITGIGSATC